MPLVPQPAGNLAHISRGGSHPASTCPFLPRTTQKSWRRDTTWSTSLSESKWETELPCPDKGKRMRPRGDSPPEGKLEVESLRSRGFEQQAQHHTGSSRAGTRSPVSTDQCGHDTRTETHWRVSAGRTCAGGERALAHFQGHWSSGQGRQQQPFRSLPMKRPSSSSQKAKARKAGVMCLGMSCGQTAEGEPELPVNHVRGSNEIERTFPTFLEGGILRKHTACSWWCWDEGSQLRAPECPR